MADTQVPARPTTGLIAWFADLNRADVPRSERRMLLEYTRQLDGLR